MFIFVIIWMTTFIMRIKKGYVLRLASACFFFTFASPVLKAQDWDWEKNIKDNSNFYSIQDAFYADPDNTAPDQDEEDGPKEIYKRWEHFMIPRVYPTGKPFAPDIIYKEWARYQASLPKYKQQFKNGDWTYVGPMTAPGKGGGTGRINCIAFQPGNPKTMWAGTPSGGLWKSTNGGVNWTTNTDNIPNLGITDIAINPRHTDTMFIATGDGFGYGLPDGGYFGGTYSNGLMRSTDGGQTWDTTSLNWQQTQSRQIFRILLFPEDPNVLVVTSSSGIWRSEDGGDHWKNVLVTRCTDIKFNPNHHGIIYAGGPNFYVSKDTGKTWVKSYINYPIATGAMTVGVTPANDSMVYILLLSGAAASTNTTLMRSTDWGQTFSKVSTITQIKFQGYYDAALNVNPANANIVYTGGVNVLRSLDGGQTWSQITYDYGFPANYYVHPDHRVFEFYPGSKDTIFNGNDGGLYMSTNGGTAWKLMSDDIHVLEFYRIGSQAYDPTLLYAGAQDNGVNQLYNGKWTHTIGGDGMTCQVSAFDPSVAYGSYQYGSIQRTDNYGASWTGLYPPSSGTANWTSPIELDPFMPNTVYFGGARLYKSEDEGRTWKSISDGIKNAQNMWTVAIAPSDNQTIYASLGSDYNPPSTPRLYRTTDGGATWASIAGGLGKASTFLTGLAVDRRDPKHVVSTFSGFMATEKVYESHDGGITWTNISSGLPNIPVNCAAFECSDENGLFIGTEIGVFYKSDKTSGWEEYNNGLPKVIVNQLEIFPAAYKIRAATYGRGVWDGVLTGQISGIAKTSELQMEMNIFPNPSTTGIFTADFPKYEKRTAAVSVFNMMGQRVLNMTAVQADTDNKAQLDLSILPAGVYTVNFGFSDGTVTKKIQILK